MPKLMRRAMWGLFKSSFTRAENLERERRNSFSSKLNVNEEYTKTFRTASYVEMHSKVQCQLERKSFELDSLNPSTSSSSSSSPLSFYKHLSDYLLEPQQDTLMKMIESLQFNHLLIDYFDASIEAYNICESLLRSIRRTRVNHRKLQKAMQLTNKSHDSSRATILRRLSSFASLNNPFSIITPEELLNNKNNNKVLLRRLTGKEKKIRRKLKLKKIIKKVGGLSLVVFNTAVIITMLVFLLHSVVGIAAAPGLMAPCLILLKRSMKSVRRGATTSSMERTAAQLDVAAKGVYILVNDFNTMSQMVKRLCDEVEHRKNVADMCVKNIGKTELLKEVMNDLCVHEGGFQEQLKELEEHIYLCFLTINRSRRLVLEEIMKSQV